MPKTGRRRSVRIIAKTFVNADVRPSGRKSASDCGQGTFGIRHKEVLETAAEAESSDPCRRSKAQTAKLFNFSIAASAVSDAQMKTAMRSGLLKKSRRRSSSNTGNRTQVSRGQEDSDPIIKINKKSSSKQARAVSTPA